MQLKIEVYKDDYLYERDINLMVRQLVNKGKAFKAALNTAYKKVSNIQYSQVINIDEKFEKDINAVEIAKDIVGKKRFKVALSK